MLPAEVTSWVKIPQAHWYINWCWEVGDIKMTQIKNMYFSGDSLRDEGLRTLIRGHSLEYWHSALPVRNGLGGTICPSSLCLLGIWRTDSVILSSYTSGFILWLVNILLVCVPYSQQASVEHPHQEALRTLLNQGTPLPSITTTRTTSKLIEHAVSPFWFISSLLTSSSKLLLPPHPLHKGDLSL